MISRRDVTFVLFTLPLLAGCKIVKNKVGGGAADSSADAQGARVSADWERRIVPYAEKKAAPLKDVVAGLKSQGDETVKEHGHAAGNGAKPVVFAIVEGTVTDIETASRAGTIGIDTTGSGKADALVQIGPVVRGSALRNGLDFIDFSQFSNQIDFAEYGKALNAHVRDVVLKGIDRDGLKGKHVRIVGAFFVDAATPTPLVTPVTIKVGS